jgi:hypothetical protein
VLSGATNQVHGTWYSVAIAFSICVVAFFAFVLRAEAEDVAKGLAWSAIPFLLVSLIVWVLIHQPAH